MNKFNVCLGTRLEKGINTVTLGFGKSFAEWVSAKVFKTDAGCGCSERRDWLDNLLGCEKAISLVVAEKPKKKKKYYPKKKKSTI